MVLIVVKTLAIPTSFSATPARRRQSIEQVRAVRLLGGVVRLPEVEVVPEALELLARLDRQAVRVAQSPRDDQGVARVLLEQFVGLDVQGARGDVPDDLIDADDLATTRVLSELKKLGIHTRCDVSKRVQKVLEDANIKLAG